MNNTEDHWSAVESLLRGFWTQKNNSEEHWRALEDRRQPYRMAKRRREDRAHSNGERSDRSGEL